MEEAEAAPAAEEAEIAPEAPAEDAPPAPPEDEPPPEFDAAAHLLAGDKPEWMKAHDIALDESGKKGFSISRDEMEALPMVAQQLITNLRRMADGSVSRNAEAAKALKLEKIELEKQSLELQAQGLAGLTVYQDERLRKFAQAPEGRQPDPHTAAGQAWLAQQEMAKLMGGFFSQVDEVLTERTAAATASEAEQALEAKRAHVTTFVTELQEAGAWDADTFAGVKTIWDAHPSLKIEDAYNLYRVQNPLDQTPAAETIEQAREAVRRKSRRPGNKTPSKFTIPQNARAADDFAWMEGLSAEELRAALAQLQHNGGVSL